MPLLVALAFYVFNFQNHHVAGKQFYRGRAQWVKIAWAYGDQLMKTNYKHQVEACVSGSLCRKLSHCG